MNVLVPCALALAFPLASPVAIQSAESATVSETGWSQAELERVSDEIKREIEEMRGLKFQRAVQVKLTDKQGFIAYAKARMAETATPDRMVRDETVAKLLGLIPEDMDLMATMFEFLEGQVGGFYDPANDTFYLMSTFNRDAARVILAHELTHALDDQHFDLDGTLKKLDQRTDSELAYQSVVEGSGTAAMNEWTVKHLKELSLSSLTDASQFDAEALTTAPPYIWKPLLAVYLRGEGFLTKSRAMNFMMKKAKTEDIVAAFRDPPRSTEQILHPEKYWGKGGDDSKKDGDAPATKAKPDDRDEPRELAFDVAATPHGWKSLGEDTLGELMLALVTTPLAERKGLDVKNQLAILGVKYTNDAAEGWGGDRLVLLGRDAARAAILVTVWDTQKDADEFRASLASVLADRLDRDSTDGPAYTLSSVGAGNSVVLTAHRGVAKSDVPALKWSEVGASKGARESRSR